MTKTYWEKIMPYYYNNGYIDCDSYYMAVAEVAHYLNRYYKHSMYTQYYRSNINFNCYDNTGTTDSAILSSFLSNYLADGFGSNVLLNEINSDADKELEREIQKFLLNKKGLHKSIILTIQDAVDFGTGFLFIPEGHVRNIPHIFMGVTLDEYDEQYVFDDGSHYITVCNKDMHIKSGLPIGDLDKGDSGTFITKIYKGSHTSAEKVGMVSRYDYCPVVPLRFNFYGNTGCGFAALSSFVKVQKYFELADKSQNLEVDPPVAVSTGTFHDMPTDGVCPGKIYPYSNDAGNNVLSPMTAPRGTSGSNFLQFWREQIHNTYFIPLIMKLGYEAPFVISTGHAFFKEFAPALLKVLFSQGEGKKILKKYGKKINDLEFKFAGAYSATALKKESSLVYSFLETAISLAKVDPQIVYSLNLDEILRRVLLPNVPITFLNSEEDVRNMQNAQRTLELLASQQVKQG